MSIVLDLQSQTESLPQLRVQTWTYFLLFIKNKSKANASNEIE